MIIHCTKIHAYKITTSAYSVTCEAGPGVVDDEEKSISRPDVRVQRVETFVRVEDTRNVDKRDFADGTNAKLKYE